MLKLHSFMRNLTLFIILSQNTESRYPILSGPENVFPGSGLGKDSSLPHFGHGT